jgi:hypothetical protein
MTKLDNVDVWAESHCRTALVYFEWDVGPRPTTDVEKGKTDGSRWTGRRNRHAAIWGA